MLDPTKKKMPHAKGQRRSPSKMVGGVKLHLESNPIPNGDARRAQTKPCMHQETPHRLSQTCFWVFACLLQRQASTVACHRGRGSGCSRPQCGISLLGGVTINPNIELPELTQDWGNRPLEGTKKTLCTPGPRRKEMWPHKRWIQTCLCVQESPAEAWACSILLRVGGTECFSECTGPFEGGCHYLHYLHHSLASGQQ